MEETGSYRQLTDGEIEALAAQNCRCADWSNVLVADDFDASRVRGVVFSGEVKLGENRASLADDAGIEQPCGIYNATLHQCTVGDGVRIANVGRHIANYRIGDGSRIENVGTIQTRPGAAFGNGLEIEPLNEGGGREVVLFDRLNSQFAHLLCLHRYRKGVIEKLQPIARAEAEKVRADCGTVGEHVQIFSVKKIVDVNVGDHATIDGASSLQNGTILSSQAAPTLVGCDVIADDFIIGEGSEVTDGAMLSKSFVGQGCRIGKQFSAEGSVFFANCEGFHGEACSVFAGPYTVTHHKSTLLIAGLFSFYNAGSGTNQSNHLYKLGPLHEGKLERGCKTGSFSYMMWPCRVGPFSVVLGKHSGTFDTRDFPFSFLEATPAGRCAMIPGLNLMTVGTVRDGAKWPTRDRRRGSVKRDRISFDVFSPMTVGRMMTGMARLTHLKETTDRSVNSVMIDGADVKRVLLNTGSKFYRSAVGMYLLEKVFARVESAIESDASLPAAALAAKSDAVFSQDWVDVGGLLMPRERLERLCAAIDRGDIDDMDAFEAELDRIQAGYREDEWAWVRWAYNEVFDKDPADMSAEDLVALAEAHQKARGKFLRLVLSDAAKEFDETIRTGFGQDGLAEDALADFTAVRGEPETNKFVRQLNDEIAALNDRVERFKQKLSSG